ncbi:transcriptional regulator [Rhodopseudomonas palustris BisB5]|uniref:Transcriptional regulator n=1 Tax=Rhodopseudomonas palustris (strain BisB5) TaxID=316057 RepID=Q138M8_RHOPS|nr:transcriptional regulator [Rhodopseudomonas palustris BisB5]
MMAAIAQARRRAGLSQTEFARRMNTTQSTVARLKSDRGQPSTRALLRFAKATGRRLKISFQQVKGRGELLGEMQFVFPPYELLRRSMMGDCSSRSADGSFNPSRGLAEACYADNKRYFSLRDVNVINADRNEGKVI